MGLRFLTPLGGRSASASETPEIPAFLGSPACTPLAFGALGDDLLARDVA